MEICHKKILIKVGTKSVIFPKIYGTGFSSIYHYIAERRVVKPSKSPFLIGMQHTGNFLSYMSKMERPRGREEPVGVQRVIR